jgi:hypothetical protein
MEIQKRPALCPACGTRYRVPETAFHKIAPCLKCGERFTIVFEDGPPSGSLPAGAEEQATADPSKRAEPEETNIPELESSGFKMVIPDDRLSVRIIPPEPVPDSITLEALKAYISQKGIVHGLIGDNDLSHLLTAAEPQEGSWLIAEGTPPSREKTRRLSITSTLTPIRSGLFAKGE